jgi:hypothetical protein
VPCLLAPTSTAFLEKKVRYQLRLCSKELLMFERTKILNPHFWISTSIPLTHPRDGWGGRPGASWTLSIKEGMYLEPIKGGYACTLCRLCFTGPGGIYTPIWPYPQVGMCHTALQNTARLYTTPRILRSSGGGFKQWTGADGWCPLGAPVLLVL